MEEFLKITYSIVLPVVVSYLLWYVKKQNTIKDARTKSILYLLETHLLELHSKYMAEGTINSSAYTTFSRMYQLYHELGGVGIVDKLYDEINQLELKNQCKKEL